jgi:hypothetical protein
MAHPARPVTVSQYICIADTTLREENPIRLRRLLRQRVPSKDRSRDKCSGFIALKPLDCIRSFGVERVTFLIFIATGKIQCLGTKTEPEARFALQTLANIMETTASNFIVVSVWATMVVGFYINIEELAHVLTAEAQEVIDGPARNSLIWRHTSLKRHVVIFQNGNVIIVSPTLQLTEEIAPLVTEACKKCLIMAP